ncbi:MAG: hydrogen peroxide-dependent heme synthase [Verrucomicrobiota bacterium]|nr:hydrogen peroxide-dependent heme synthase [Verrucomicrobiota bacterium]
MPLPAVKLTRGIHVMHLFYKVDRAKWEQNSATSSESLKKLELLCSRNSAPSHPRLTTYANVGGKADLAFMLMAAELGEIGQMHRDLETCFPSGALQSIYTYLSITELPDYVTSEEDMRNSLVRDEKLSPGTPEFVTRLIALKERHAQYEHYRLYPEMPDWEVMGFYPMSKRRTGMYNWYSLDFEARKKLMTGHARVGRKYAGRISQLITGSTGLDDWEWGVTLMAHQTDALKEIVYEMRFDEVSARYGEFGPFYVNLRLQPADLWPHLHL